MEHMLYIGEENSKGDFLLTATEVKVPKGKRMIKEHRHSRFEIVHFRKGYGIYTVNGQNYSIRSGDVFVFSSNEQHCITEIFEQLEYVNIHFEPSFFWSSNSDGFSDAGIFFYHSKEFCCRLNRGNVETKAISDLIEGILYELIHKQSEYKMMARSKLINIMVTLVRTFGYIDEESKQKANSTVIKAVKKSMNYIGKHLTEKITLDEISNYVGMSRSYFSTVFKSTLGISLWNYICEKRVELVLRKLEENSEKSMLDIALECGFNNTANFNKTFKRQTGRTPHEYKIHGNAYIYL